MEILRSSEETRTLAESMLYAAAGEASPGVVADIEILKIYDEDCLERMLPRSKIRQCRKGDRSIDLPRSQVCRCDKNHRVETEVGEVGSTSEAAVGLDTVTNRDLAAWEDVNALLHGIAVDKSSGYANLLDRFEDDDDYSTYDPLCEELDHFGFGWGYGRFFYP